ncbi:MAG: hypothetical protein IT430_17770 [Phycisphaerales bacterium]|nr:hypothetical protein [Phycisphaerales bacterium]
MNWREWKNTWPWWHRLTPVILVATPLVYFALTYAVLIPMTNVAAANPTDAAFDNVGRMMRFTFAVAIVMIAVLFVWVLLVCAWLDAGNARFSESIPPATRAKQLRFTAWTPFCFALFLGIVPFVETLGNWLLNKMWEPPFMLSWWLAIPIVLLAAHGWWFGRLLQRRLRTTVSRARLCYHCAYSLAEIPNCTRCPECGTEVSA